MTPDEELRLECLRLAIASGSSDPIEDAKRMESYIHGMRVTSQD